MTSETCNLLHTLASRYEVATFSAGDPSFVLRRFSAAGDAELLAFVAAMISFGRRDQFVPIIERIMQRMGDCGGPASYVKAGAWEQDFPDNGATFYRYYKQGDMHALFARLQEVLAKYDCFGDAVRCEYSKIIKAECYKKRDARWAISDGIASLFCGCKLVPHTISSARKKVLMYLRWMVRDSSPVDIGLWKWYDKSRLLIPLDTHVLRQSVKLGLLPKNSPANASSVIKLTDVLLQVFPSDPTRADFALFGLGVDGR